MTLSDLAAELNVSTATVSRALTRPEAVAQATRERILRAVRRADYRPNGIARSLRTQQTQTIGVIVSDIRNPFFASIVKAIEDVARANGYTVLICNADEDGRNEEAALHLFLERKVSGVIHCSAGANVKLLRLLQKQAVPMVDLDRQSGLDMIDTVILDNELAASLAARHLLELGHRRIAMISGPKHLSNARGRLDGFCATMRKARAAVPREYIVFGDFREESGRNGADRLLSLPNPPTAIFVANNEMTAGAVSVIRTRNVKLPRDLSLVGFDEARWAQYLYPPLTVVVQPTEAMGKRAAELLLARLTKKSGFRREVFEPRLVVRGSTARPR